MFVVFFEVPSFAFSQLLPRFEARNSSIKMWVSKPIKIKRAEEAAKIVRRRHNKTLGGHSLTTFTRGGGYVVQKCRLIVNSYQVDNKCQRRGVGGQKKPKSCQRS